MIQRRIAGVWAFLAVLLFSAQSAAIGPSNQTINPTFDSVVRIMYDNGLGGGIGQFNGTGSVIDYKQLANGDGAVCVLTADHVLSRTQGPNGLNLPGLGIAFGNSGNNSGNSAYFKANYVARPNFNNGPMNVDIGVLTVDIGPYDPALTALSRKLIPATAFFYFTDIGYGNEGKLNAGLKRYDAQGKYGTERYLNDKIGTFQMNANVGGYTYEAAEWFVTGPPPPNTNIVGTGAGFDGDSGSPFFSSTSVLDPNNNINYFTDNQFAVFTANQRDINGNVKFGSTQYAVALDQADIRWIEGVCPEPTSLSLAASGVLGLLVFWRSRRVRKS
jgi:hypothetical protein